MRDGGAGDVEEPERKETESEGNRSESPAWVQPSGSWAVEVGPLGPQQPSRNVETNSGVAFGAEEKGPGEGGGGKRDETDERMKDFQVVRGYFVRRLSQSGRYERRYCTCLSSKIEVVRPIHQN